MNPSRSVVGKAMLNRSQRLVRQVHEGLLEWARVVLLDARLPMVEPLSEFPPQGRSGAFLTLYPYAVGTAPGLTNTARPAALLGLTSDRAPGSTGVPPSWAQLSGLITEGLGVLWPRQPRQPRLPAPVCPVAELPGPLAEWYQAQSPEDPWLRDGAAHLPALWWIPGIDLRVDFLVTGEGGARGTTTDSPSPTLIAALAALIAAVHHEGGFDVLMEAPILDGPAGSFCAALARSQPDPDGGLARALQHAAETLGAPAQVSIDIVRTNELSPSEMFSLMQALQRPLQAASCFMLQVRVGELLRFEPAALVRGSDPVSGRFVVDLRSKEGGP